jgi:hypothetical protein
LLCIPKQMAPLTQEVKVNYLVAPETSSWVPCYSHTSFPLICSQHLKLILHLFCSKSSSTSMHLVNSIIVWLFFPLSLPLHEHSRPLRVLQCDGLLCLLRGVPCTQQQTNLPKGLLPSTQKLPTVPHCLTQSAPGWSKLIPSKPAFLPLCVCTNNS